MELEQEWLFFGALWDFYIKSIMFMWKGGRVGEDAHKKPVLPFSVVPFYVVLLTLVFTEPFWIEIALTRNKTRMGKIDLMFVKFLFYHDAIDEF